MFLHIQFAKPKEDLGLEHAAKKEMKIDFKKTGEQQTNVWLVGPLNG